MLDNVGAILTSKASAKANRSVIRWPFSAFKWSWDQPIAAREEDCTMFIKQGTKAIPILMYHGISQFAHPKYRDIALSPISFSAQIDYLYRSEYTPLSVTVHCI